MGAVQHRTVFFCQMQHRFSVLGSRFCLTIMRGMQQTRFVLAAAVVVVHGLTAESAQRAEFSFSRICKNRERQRQTPSENHEPRTQNPEPENPEPSNPEPGTGNRGPHRSLLCLDKNNGFDSNTGSVTELSHETH